MLRTTLRRVLHSRTALTVGVALSVLLPALTLHRLPAVNPWPLLAGLVPWLVGTYLLCPLRWRAITETSPDAPTDRRWYLRAFAESELLGLLTPGHIGADVWRFKRLTGAGLARGDALLSVGVDRLFGVVGLAVFVGFAVPDLPPKVLLISAGVGVVAVLVALLGRKWRPRLLPAGPLPRPRALVIALILSAGHQLSLAGLLLGAVASTGHVLSPLTILAAFGVSELAAAVPGFNGASPHDGALIVALVALGVPWGAAAGAVALKAILAWLPALVLGGISLWMLRRQSAPAVA